MSAEVAVPPGAPAHGLTLRRILDENQAAYSGLVDAYRATAALRAADAPLLLQPVLNALDARRSRDTPPPTTASVLELGCADGVFTSWMARRGLVVTAVEYAEPMRRAARERLAADRAPRGRVTILPDEFHDGNETAMPLRGRRFDVVVAMAFVHLFPAETDLAVLRQIADLLAPDGVAFLTTTVETEDRRGFELKEGPHGSRSRYRSRYTEDTFLALVGAAGLEVLNKECQMDPQVDEKTWLDVIAVHPGADR